MTPEEESPEPSDATPGNWGNVELTPEQEDEMLKMYDSVPLHETVDMHLPHERNEFL